MSDETVEQGAIEPMLPVETAEVASKPSRSWLLPVGIGVAGVVLASITGAAGYALGSERGEHSDAVVMMAEEGELPFGQEELPGGDGRQERGMQGRDFDGDHQRGDRGGRHGDGHGEGRGGHEDGNRGGHMGEHQGEFDMGGGFGPGHGMNAPGA